MTAIALLAGAPAFALWFVVAKAWCVDHHWAIWLSAPITLAGASVLTWWWCGPHREREWIATRAEPLSDLARPYVEPALEAVRARFGFDRQVEVWLVPERATNAWALGNRHVLVTAGFVGEPRQLQEAILAHELAHLGLGHGWACWALEQVMSGWEQLIGRLIVNEADSRWIPGSLVAAFGLVMGFAVFALPLFVLRLSGATLGRTMEWEADRLAARLGYGEQLDAFLGRVQASDGMSTEIGLFTWTARIRTHPAVSRRRAAVQTGRIPRDRPSVATRRSAHVLLRVTRRVGRWVIRELLWLPVNCLTIVVVCSFASIGMVQARLHGAMTGAPMLLPLAVVIGRWRPMTALRRPHLLRVGLALTLGVNGMIIADPSLARD